MTKRLFLLIVGTVMSIAATASISTAQETKEVIFGEFKPYVPASKWFSVDLPTNWTIKDNSKNGEVILSISDPSANAGVSIHVWRQDKPLDGGAAKYLKDYLDENLGTLKNFSEGEAKVQKDGSTGIYFSWDEPMSGKTIRMWGDSFIEQRGGLVGMIVLLIPEEQYKKKQASAYRLVNSFGLNP